ncbi:MAG: VanZ family protein [Candidatus Moranbacteria bacterium]|nr:VanZ family protein [Candidatus Moranbacteria bacterium]
MSKLSAMRKTDMNRWSVTALVLWMSVIFYFSSMSGTTSASLAPFDSLLERKGAHVFEYLVLSLLVFNVLRRTFIRERLGAQMALIASLSLLYALSDEIHQLFVPGREGKLSDIGIDLVGIFLGILLIVAVSVRKSGGNFFTSVFPKK